MSSGFVITSYQILRYKESRPKPDYVCEPCKEGLVHDVGEGVCRWQTFELQAHWTADTRIQYRPNAKAPGLKRQLRYATAQTVGQSLALGSYPIEWTFGYQQGFIKITGCRPHECCSQKSIQSSRWSRCKVRLRRHTGFASAWRRSGVILTVSCFVSMHFQATWASGLPAAI